MTDAERIRKLTVALVEALKFMQIDTKFYVANGVTEELRLRVIDGYIKSVEAIREGLEIAKSVKL